MNSKSPTEESIQTARARIMNSCVSKTDSEWWAKWRIDELKSVLRSLIEASTPFTTSDVVEETSGTVFFMEALVDAIEDAHEALHEEEE